MDLGNRLAFATDTARKAGAFAHDKFTALDQLHIESKGQHDLVSEADRDTEMLIRTAIEQAFADDGIVGEEHGRKHGTSGFDWVIDPIDGTANYVAGIPHWCVVLACAWQGLPVVGVIFDPCTGETFTATKGGGAHVNGKPLKVSGAAALTEGSVATGTSGRTGTEQAAMLVRQVLVNGGLFYRSASGALMLAYVAAGRLLGYLEDRMNSWDCFAGLLMIEEAGGIHLPLDPVRALEHGTVLVAGGPRIYPQLEKIGDRVFGERAPS